MFNSVLWAAIRKKYTTHYKFCDAVGCHSIRLAEVLHGDTELTKKEKTQWAKLLDSTVEELFGDETADDTTDSSSPQKRESIQETTTS